MTGDGQGRRRVAVELEVVERWAAKVLGGGRDALEIARGEAAPLVTPAAPTLYRTSLER